MSNRFPEYKKFDLSQINKEILAVWNQNGTFKKTLKLREGHPTFVFYEGPPSANGMPGIHHVMARTIKDIFCRFKTMKGFYVERKAGWDTHGLPVELGVEKALGITKEDIGKKISISEYNNACRKDVMKYTDLWEELTEKMGYWVDMEHPYITYDNRYIETLWWLLKKLYEKGLLYKGYTIQPYSPAAGTGLSTHELNQPGCYRDVKDTTAVAQFKAIRNSKSEFLFSDIDTDLYFLAWTTTPWTLPSNTALAVGKDITYVKVRSFNPYTGAPITAILAKDLLPTLFNSKYQDMALEDYKEGGKELPFKVLAEYKGEQLIGTLYEQLIPWVNPGDGAFRVIAGDFVTTEDGTGIVHIAPTFGADDDRAAKQSGVPPLILFDKAGNRQPMVDRTGKFFTIEDLDPKFVSEKVNTEKYKEFAGRFVKNAYDSNLTDQDTTLDVDLAVMLKQQNKAFKIEKHVHNYPHCWRTDKPVLYYPLDSWFIKTTALRERMIELNDTINWKPASTGSGRFGKWLENLQDWNLSRSRYWGTPLPIWRTEDKKEEICIGSVAELKGEIEKSVKAGFMSANPLEKFSEGNYSENNYNLFDLHRPFVDDIILVSASGKKMMRETDLIDVWFDSGAMPYAQNHFPFENANDYPYKTDSGKIVPLEKTDRGVYPADFIAEGVDQTRGWFFTLHAIAVMLFDSVAFKNIVSNGLVLDKNGNKMSKRLGNAVDPFETIEKYGSDPLRWYMITNAQPWDNLKFDLGGIDEVNRKFFGTLYNTYSFFALYSNVDKFVFSQAEIPVKDRPEIDRWIISLLNTLIKEVEECYETYEPTRAGRAIADFVTENLSNWYVRLNRKRYWGGEMDSDKVAAYQTLYTCLATIAKLAAPIAPFYADKLYIDLNSTTNKENFESVHLADFPKYDSSLVDKDLEERMDLAQRISSLVLGLRRKVNIKVRQPLQKIMIPLLDMSLADKINEVQKLILTEVNVKELKYVDESEGILVKKIKPNFKTLGPKYGKQMKGISAAFAAFDQAKINQIDRLGDESLSLMVDGVEVLINREDAEITSEDIPGWLVASDGKLTVALDITLTQELVEEGLAREFINRIQNIRKDSGFDVTDKISIKIQKHESIISALNNYKSYIAAQTLAREIELVDTLNEPDTVEIEIEDNIKTLLKLIRIK
jgi:isoleucyl-tRNA synthetase